MSSVKRRLQFGSPSPKRSRTFASKSMVRNAAESQYRNLGITLIGSPSNSYGISSVSQGDGVQERSGSKILCTGFEFRLTGNSAPLRMVVYSPKNPSDILTLPSFTDPIDNSQYWVHYDKILPMGQSSSESTLQFTHCFKLSKRLVVMYAGDDTNTAVRNPVFLYLHSGAADTTGTLVQGHSKMWFKDF